MFRHFVSIVLPAFNEARGLERVLPQMPIKSIKKMGYGCEVVVVDNNSSDATVAVARRYKARVVKETAQGYGRAYKKGLGEAKGDILVCMDPDGTYPCGQIGEMITLMITAKLDLVIGNRLAAPENIPAFNRLNLIGNKWLSFLTRLLYGIPLTDSQSGMWAITRKMYDLLVIRFDLMGFSQELKIDAIFFAKARWTEVGIKYTPRIGRPKLKLLRNGIDNNLRLILKRVMR